MPDESGGNTGSRAHPLIFNSVRRDEVNRERNHQAMVFSQSFVLLLLLEGYRRASNR